MAADPQHSLVVVGASAGGVEALSALARDLPEDFPAAIAVVLHLPASATSVLPAILNRAGPLPALAATDAEALAPGRIYVAPPDHHLLAGPGELTLSHGPRENGHRPAVDTLFRTAALSYGPSLVGVVLSGTLDDGAAGLAIVKARGGTTIVQDPDDAAYRGMPQAAVDTGAADHVVPLRKIAPLLAELVGAEPPEHARPEPLPDPIPMLRIDDNADVATGIICPECGGALWEIQEGGVHRFRCRIGHSFSDDTLLDMQGTEVEAALWTALRALEERASLMRRMSDRAGAAGNTSSAATFMEKSVDLERQAEIVRAGVLPVSVHLAAGDENLAP